MGRFPKFLILSSLALLAGLGFSPSAVRAAEPIDNDELVAAPEFEGLPDKDSHSGVFLDLIAAGSNSLINPNLFGIVLPAATPSLRVAIFDGNAGGMWDQNRVEYDALGNVVPDGSVVEYTLSTAAPGFPETVIARADSENATPRAGATLFMNAVDGRWQFLYDGPHHPNALAASGEHLYRLLVAYRQPTPTGSGIAPINGYKVACNGPFGLIPLVVGNTLTGGFIGGVVDSRNLRFAFPGAPVSGDEYSVSRDHYPDLLEPSASLNALLTNGPTYAPAVRFPSPDPFVNRYNGTFDLKLRLVPPAGQPWPEFLQMLVLEEGDADDIDDVSGIGPNGLPSPSNPGIPPDDGGVYILNGVRHDNSGYRLPVAAAPDPVGSPWLELLDPNGVVRTTLFDLSGNVSQEDATGDAFEKIPVPLDGFPGTWTIRMHNLDARNSWFLRTNAAFVPRTQNLSGRIYCDADCNGIDNGDAGIPGVVVTIRRTDIAGVPDLFATTGADGSWQVTNIAVGTYSVFVTAGQTAIGGRPASSPQPLTATVASGVSTGRQDLGYCCKTECKCGPDGRLHQICFEATVWAGDCKRADTDVYVRLDAGCDCGPLEDLACFTYSGKFPGDQVGRNGIITVKNVVLVDGTFKVCVCLDANSPTFPAGYFTGSQRLEVVVNGISVAACDCLRCDRFKVGDVFPSGWKPQWCDDVPHFTVKTLLAWECWPDKPCTDGCVKGKAWWKTVNKYGKCEATKIGWPAPADEDQSLVCDKSWLKILNTSTRCDAWTALAQEYIAAKLNGFAGACTPKSVQAAIDEAKSLLEQYCGGFAGAWLTEERANLLRKILEQYNAGKMGPLACGIEIPKCCPPPPPPCVPTPPKCEKPKGNNGVGNGLDPQPPGNPPVNDGPGTGPGNPGNKSPKDSKDSDDGKSKGDKPSKDSDDGKSKGDKPSKDCEKPKGNNGVGNGLDPQPPGNPPVNDGPGTGPGRPGNKK